MTKLLYLEAMQQYECDAVVIDVLKTDPTPTLPSNEERETVTLDQTVFYPQGGGQPYDAGTITNREKEFVVNEVRFVDGMVRHIGAFVGEPFSVGDKVVCRVNVERRKLNTRLHSAGHLLDMAMRQMGVPWVAVKGHHFPDGPYVEYAGSLGGVDAEEFKTKLEAVCNALISQALSTDVRFVSKSEMATLCESVPDYIPADKPGRVVLYGTFGIPCGGTHVANLADIGKLIVRKVKQHGENTIKVAYGIDPS